MGDTMRGIGALAPTCLLAACTIELGAPTEEAPAADAAASPADAEPLPQPDAAPPPPDAQALQPCVEGDDRTQDPETGTCYVLLLGRSTWVGARTACGALGGDLARIDDAAENDRIFDLASPYAISGCDAEDEICDFWVGGNDRDDEGHWVWLDDTVEIGPPLFEQWRAGQPNNSGGEDCMLIEADNPNREWDDRDCGTMLPIVCERPQPPS